jgi:hypothetical protein
VPSNLREDMIWVGAGDSTAKYVLTFGVGRGKVELEEVSDTIDD